MGINDEAFLTSQDIGAYFRNNQHLQLFKEMARQAVFLIKNRHPIEPMMFEFINKLKIANRMQPLNLTVIQKREITKLYRSIQLYNSCNLTVQYGKHMDEMIFRVPYQTEDRPPLFENSSKTTVSIWELYAAYTILDQERHNDIRQNLQSCVDAYTTQKSVRANDLLPLQSILDHTYDEMWGDDPLSEACKRRMGALLPRNLKKRLKRNANRPSNPDSTPMFDLDKNLTC